MHYLQRRMKTFATRFHPAHGKLICVFIEHYKIGGIVSVQSSGEFFFAEYGEENTLTGEREVGTDLLITTKETDPFYTWVNRPEVDPFCMLNGQPPANRVLCTSTPIKWEFIND